MFESGMASDIQSYLEYRKSMNYGGEGEERYLLSFDRYCAENFPEETRLIKECVRGWFHDEISKGRLALENKAITIRMLARFLGPSSYMLPMNCVPKTPLYVPYIMTEKELSGLFQAADSLRHSRDSFLDEVFPVMIRFIYACGLRPGEALRLKTEDVDLRTGTIFIRNTKRHKDRIIVASDDALTLLKKFDLIRRIRIARTEYFFCNGSGCGIKRGQLNYAVKCSWQNSNPGIDPSQLPKVRTYDLRHRFASAVLQRWIDEGKDLYAMLPYLRAYMGHQSFSDTMYYIHLLPDRLVNSPGVDWDRLDQVGLEESLWNN